MALHKLALPDVSEDAIADMAFASLDPLTVLVVYEAHRDFLSAPRKHIALRIDFSNAIAMNTCGEWLSDVHWRALDKELGVFKIESSEVVLQKNEQHLLLVHSQGVLEFCATGIEVVKTLYHQASSKVALGECLASL